MDNTSHYSQLWAKVASQVERKTVACLPFWFFFFFSPLPSSGIREPMKVVSSMHTRPGKHVCCVMEKSKSLPVNQFSAPCMLPRAEWQEEIQPQANKRAQHAEDEIKQNLHWRFILSCARNKSIQCVAVQNYAELGERHSHLKLKSHLFSLARTSNYTYYLFSVNVFEGETTLDFHKCFLYYVAIPFSKLNWGLFLYFLSDMWILQRQQYNNNYTIIWLFTKHILFKAIHFSVKSFDLLSY